MKWFRTGKNKKYKKNFRRIREIVCTTPYYSNDRDLGHFSDHMTVWIDKHIGVEETYEDIKTKFDDNIQILKSNNLTEMEIDDDSIACTDPKMLENLKDEVYCLKYFSEIDKALAYIHQHPEKRIFFISSGTIGKEVVPKIVDLPQIRGIYIFCGNISYHTTWARDYADYITAMLEHQDNLLERLTRDIAEYVEEKGDRHKANGDIIPAKNCYAWSKKLLTRGKMLGDHSLTKLFNKIDKKLEEIQSFAESPSEN